MMAQVGEVFRKPGETATPILKIPPAFDAWVKSLR
jgi:hypothetical protein